MPPVIAAVATVASAAGAAATGVAAGIGSVAGTVGLSGAATALGAGTTSGFIAGAASMATQGAIYGGVIGGTTSAIQGGSFVEGAKTGAKFGAVGAVGGFAGGAVGGSLAGGAGSAAFTTAKTVGGFLGSGGAGLAAGASPQQALVMGAAGGFEQFGAAKVMQDTGKTWSQATNIADNFKAAYAAAPTVAKVGAGAVSSSFAGAQLPQIETGFRPVEQMSGTGDPETSFQDPVADTQGVKRTPAPDVMLPGAGLNLSFDPSLTAAYQDRPSFSADFMSKSRASFSKERAMQKRRPELFAMS